MVHAEFELENFDHYSHLVERILCEDIAEDFILKEKHH